MREKAFHVRILGAIHTLSVDFMLAATTGEIRIGLYYKNKAN